MQFLISAEWIQQEAEERGDRGRPTQRSRSSSRTRRSSRSPTTRPYKEFLKTSGQTEEDLLFRVRARLPVERDPQEGRGRQGQGHRQGRSRTTTTRTRSASPSPSARPQRRAHRRPRRRPSRPRSALEDGESFKAGRQEVLDRRGVQGAGRQAARRRQGPAGEGARRGRLQGREGRARRARSRPSSATTSSRSRRSRPPPSRRSSSRRRRSATCCKLGERAEGARRLRQEVPHEVQGGDELRGGLRGRRVQERAEGEGQGGARGRQPRVPAAAARPAARGPGALRTTASRRSPASTQITRRLRRECPWDREQDERSIVPHTVEEAYELADAAHSGDDAKLLDELGDVLFQVHFLSLLLEERGAGDLAAVADGCREKLIRRHPHVFGEVEARDAGEVLRNWDEIKRDGGGRAARLFGDVPENLPGPLYARKVQRRAAGAGHALPAPAPGAGGRRARRPPSCARAARGGEEAFRLVGDLLFAPSPRPGAGGGSRARAAGGRRPLQDPDGGETARHERDPRRSTPARCSTAAATPPSRSTCASSRARPAARRCPPARPPASSRRSSCATAARPGAARASTRRWPTSNGEIAEAVRGLDAADQAGARPRDDRARRHAEQGPARRQRHPRRVARRGQGRRGRGRACRSGATSAATAAHVLPVPMMNVLNGGAHADNNVDFQEFMVVPVGCDSLLRGAARRRRGLPRAASGMLHERGLATAVGDEGGFAPDLESNEAALEVLMEGIEAAGYSAGRGRRRSRSTRPPARSSTTAPTCSSTRTARSPPRRWPTTGPSSRRAIPILSIEDGMDEEDWDGWKRAHRAHRRRACSSWATTSS